jgi:formylglycine-generating enzyme required for sulfatase activity
MKRLMQFVSACVLETALLPANAAGAASAFPPMATGPEKKMMTSTGIELVWIPPGEFMLGSTPAEQQWALANGAKADGIGFEGKKPRKAAIKQGFWLGRTEVTVGQWKQFVAATSYKTDAEKAGSADSAPIKGEFWGRAPGASWRDPKFPDPPKDNHPVCCITWNDATEFCLWLTQTEKKAKKLPSGMICRLPTEAEWEYACRGGKHSFFWWGDDKLGGERRLNWNGKADGFDFVSPVDQFKTRGRNRFGLADMLGNVWEWCLDGFDPEGAHEEPNKGGARSVLRGGSFRDLPGAIRCATRSSGYPKSTYACFGFRVALGVER